MKGTDVMIELLRNAQSTGHHADYVLFDTWFSSPAQLIAVKELGLDSIAMIKKSSRIYYEYEGAPLAINKIFGLCKKRHGQSKYLLSVIFKERSPFWVWEVLVIYPRMRSIGIVYILSLVACIIAMSVFNKHRNHEHRYNIRKSLWRGLRYWAFLSFAVVIICIIVCRKKMDEIES